MDNMNFTSVQYTIDEQGNSGNIKAIIDGIEMSVPLDPANRHYAAIMKQVANGDLVIAAAEE